MCVYIYSSKISYYGHVEHSKDIYLGLETQSWLWNKHNYLFIHILKSYVLSVFYELDSVLDVGYKVMKDKQ